MVARTESAHSEELPEIFIEASFLSSAIAAQENAQARDTVVSVAFVGQRPWPRRDREGWNAQQREKKRMGTAENMYSTHVAVQ
jgi:hypothetical protein